MEDNSIFSTLGNFQKVELEDIMHFFGARIPSRVRKQEFVDRLGAYLIRKPEEWLRRMPERDLRLLKRLIDAGPDIPLFLDYPDYPSVLETVRLVNSDTSDANFRKLWVGSELYGIVSPLIDGVIAECETNGHFDRERAALGYLNLYGVMRVKEFMSHMFAFYEYAGRGDAADFLEAVYDSPILKLCRFDSGSGRYVSAPCLFEPEEILRGRKEYPDVREDRSFTPEEALEAGMGAPFPVFGLHSKAGTELVSMLRDLGYGDEEIFHEAHGIWMNAQSAMDDNSTEAVFTAVTRKQDSIASFDYFNACMQKVAAYANSLPKWLLRGHSPDEVNYLKVILQSEEDPIRDLVEEDPLLGLFIPPAPGDNPCPCGSGLLYRNCHGKCLS